MGNLLSEKLRPKSLNEVLGQEHLVGKDGIIRSLIKANKLFSMILFGNPGTGKTSLAEAITNEIKINSRHYNAVLNNKQDLMMIIDEAKMNGGGILVLDEIHRLNKDKQDILLPLLESGLITLIGITTANPYHKINPAIRSRLQIFELYPLTNQDVIKGIKRGVRELENITIDLEGIKLIANLAQGDLRFALNLLEVAYYSNNEHIVNPEVIRQVNSKANFFHDKNESGHYDTLSAFQKSIRGSDIDASLHYLARLIIAGDFESIYRRMSVIAYEDIGLANPSIGPKVMAAIDASERLGMPEAKNVLGVIVSEMALSPKSNSAYLAINQALHDIENINVGSVPNNIKTHSKDYLYPHDYPNNYVEQQYLPNNIKNKKYYHPGKNKYEQNLINNPGYKKITIKLFFYFI